MHNESAEGVPEPSQGLRSNATIPLDSRPHSSGTLKAVREWFALSSQAVLAPLSGCD